MLQTPYIDNASIDLQYVPLLLFLSQFLLTLIFASLAVINYMLGANAD
jgi:hypothetical protein